MSTHTHNRISFAGRDVELPCNQAGDEIIRRWNAYPAILEALKRIVNFYEPGQENQNRWQHIADTAIRAANERREQ